MTKLNIDTNLLRDSVDTSLNEVKNHLKSIENSASSINVSQGFTGSDKIANIPSKIEHCIDRINETIEWYKNCCNDYDRFSDEAISDIGSIEVNSVKTKNFNI